MIIEKHTLGSGKRRHDVYAIVNTPAESGDRYGSEIARFDNLEIAATVLRYMTGGELSGADRMRAQIAMKNAAAPTDQSRCNREAE